VHPKEQLDIYFTEYAQNVSKKNDFIEKIEAMAEFDFMDLKLQ
jgi:hypothetical protein